MPVDLRRLLLEPGSVPGPGGQRACEEPGCGRLTEHGKPFCAEHVEHNPYARAVLDKIRRRELQDAEVAEKGAIGGTCEDITAVEIQAYLRLRGVVTFARLCRDLCLRRKAAWGYVTLLQCHRIAERTYTKETGVWRVGPKVG